MLYGAEKSARPDRGASFIARGDSPARPETNIVVVEGFAARLAVLPFDDRAAAHYGQIRGELERKGTPIGPYDLMIAAHARCEGLTLVTHNVREFRRVAGLRVENWVSPGSRSA